MLPVCLLRMLACCLSYLASFADLVEKDFWVIPVPNTNAKQVLSLSRLVVPYRDGVTQGKKCRQGTNEIPRSATVHSALCTLLGRSIPHYE